MASSDQENNNIKKTEKYNHNLIYLSSRMDHAETKSGSVDIDKVLDLGSENIIDNEFKQMDMLGYGAHSKRRPSHRLQSLIISNDDINMLQSSCSLMNATPRLNPNVKAILGSPIMLMNTVSMSSPIGDNRSRRGSIYSDVLRVDRSSIDTAESTTFKCLYDENKFRNPNIRRMSRSMSIAPIHDRSISSLAALQNLKDVHILGKETSEIRIDIKNFLNKDVPDTIFNPNTTIYQEKPKIKFKKKKKKRSRLKKDNSSNTSTATTSSKVKIRKSIIIDIPREKRTKIDIDNKIE